MPDILPFPDKRYTVIYADPPWAYRQAGATQKARGTAVKHYPTMTTAEICAMPVREICAGGSACFLWATFPNIGDGIKVLEAWGFEYKTAAFVLRHIAKAHPAAGGKSPGAEGIKNGPFWGRKMVNYKNRRRKIPFERQGGICACMVYSALKNPHMSNSPALWCICSRWIR